MKRAQVIEVIHDNERIRGHIQHETDGERTPAQVQREFTPEQLREIELLSAVDMLADMRNVKDRSRAWSDEAREKYRQRFEALSRDFAAAAEHLERLRADKEFTPLYLVRA